VVFVVYRGVTKHSAKRSRQFKRMQKESDDDEVISAMHVL
jgi:hypothetical protein